MRTSGWIWLLAAAGVGCVTTKEVPVQQMADSRAAIRAAEELGAAEVVPAAQHLELARQQAAIADREISQGNERRAAFILERAAADAELALALAREDAAKRDAERVLERVRILQSEVQR